MEDYTVDTERKTGNVDVTMLLVERKLNKINLWRMCHQKVLGYVTRIVWDTVINWIIIISIVIITTIELNLSFLSSL